MRLYIHISAGPTPDQRPLPGVGANDVTFRGADDQDIGAGRQAQIRAMTLRRTMLKDVSWRSM
jgi:hypothetical protein